MLIINADKAPQYEVSSVLKEGRMFYLGGIYSEDEAIKTARFQKDMGCTDVKITKIDPDGTRDEISLVWAEKVLANPSLYRRNRL